MRLTSLYHLGMKTCRDPFAKKTLLRSRMFLVSILLAGCPSSDKTEPPKPSATSVPAAPEKPAIPSVVTPPTSPTGTPAAAPVSPGTVANNPAVPSAAKTDGGAGQVIQVPITGDGIKKIPSLCEVEFKGRIAYSGKLPEGQRWFFAVAQGSDCLSKDAHIIGNFWADGNGTFFGEVFTKWASDLALCVAAVSTPNGPSTLYAKAKGPFHAEKTGEVEFFGLELSPKPGPKIQFAPGRAPM